MYFEEVIRSHLPLLFPQSRCLFWVAFVMRAFLSKERATAALYQLFPLLNKKLPPTHHLSRFAKLSIVQTKCVYLCVFVCDRRT